MAILTPNKLYKDLDFSFEAHPETKDVLKKVDNNALKQSIKSLLSTIPGERLFQPNVGANMNRLLFEPIDFITTEVIRQNINNTLVEQEPRIRVEQVDVVPQYEENSYEITIFFTVIGINQPTSVSITLERLR